MYARTVYNFLMHLFRGGDHRIDLNDEITRATLVTYAGEIVNSDVAKRRIP
jgi:hypothetical protein